MFVLILAALPIPIDLERTSLNRAKDLKGRFVVASMLVGKPPWSYQNVTVTGTADGPDGVERSAIIRGKRLNVEGKRILVVGTLRVIEHSTWMIGDIVIPPWWEIRVEE